MPTNIVMHGEFITANQDPSLMKKNIWVFTAGEYGAKLKGDSIIKIEK
jgi:hypothetical protein